MNVQPLIPEHRLRVAATRPTVSKHALRIRLYLVLVLTDLACILLSFALGALVRFGDLGGDDWYSIAFAAMPIYLGMAANSGAYSIATLRSPARGAILAMGALVFTFASLFVISYFLKTGHVSRLVIGIGILSSFASIAIARKQLGEFIVRATGGRFTNVIVIGDGAPIRVPPGATYLDAQSVNLAADTQNPEMLQRLANELRGADRVVISCRRDLCRNWAMLLKGCTVQGELLADEFDSVGAIGVGRLCGRTTIVVSAGPLNVPQRILKRGLDLVLTVPALIALAPVLVLTAIAIKLDSPGPVFFRQQRVGRGNELFEIYKFRSMRVEDSDPMGHRSTMPDDDRLTRVGRFIRKTSIDELPQLLNVLFGSMSIVGPRPHALGSLAGQQLFWEVDERYWHRHALKPGITGLAQIRGYRGPTHRRDDLTRRLQADLEYLSGWSIWRDIGIIISTLRVIVHPQAY